ncbi:hypothetical protein DFJ67_3851 [Asanoa ferruginea]|uniref:Excreted virulence factor EspC (Type VII ESX diderm) n=1 Tax=Asanoa ferruginea TaxID=53367 RepID=A0A3D9ZMM8_9ACTN|nr:hypothetical protein [Asanoa ferruginea]REF97844.1 hypothetical protein DFJ67_3851 [Asanoa ferruginea]GIF52987.1 hypothetical protein Afe04nite_75260 [Asanoa ferruginea]
MASTDLFAAYGRRLTDAGLALAALPSQDAPDTAAAWHEFTEAKAALLSLVQSVDYQTTQAYAVLPSRLAPAPAAPSDA